MRNDMAGDIKIKMHVKHDAKDASPGSWGLSALTLKLKASKHVVERVEQAINRALIEDESSAKSYEIRKKLKDKEQE